MKKEYDELFRLHELDDNELETLAETFPALDVSELSDITAKTERRITMNSDFQEKDVVNEVEVCHKIPWYRRPVFGAAAMLAIVFGIAVVGVNGLLYNNVPSNDSNETPIVAAQITTTAEMMQGTDSTETATEAADKRADDTSTDETDEIIFPPCDHPDGTENPTEPPMTETPIDPIKTNPNITEVQTIPKKTDKTTPEQKELATTTTTTWEVVHDPKLPEDTQHSNPMIPAPRANGYTVQQAAGTYMPTNGMISYNGHQITIIQIAEDGRLSVYTNERNLEFWEGKIMAVSRYDGDNHSFVMLDPSGYYFADFNFYGEDSLDFPGGVTYQRIPTDLSYID